MKTIKILFLLLAFAHVSAFAASFPMNIKLKNVLLSGDIHFPEQGASTAIILVGGSGATLRTDTAKMNGLFHRLGFAVANFDRRGNGESTGEYQRPNAKNSAAQIPVFAEDVAAIADAIKLDGRFKIKKLIVMGSSMGAWIAPHAATLTNSIDLVINFVGAASTVAKSDHFDYLTDMGLSIEQALGMMHTLKADNSYNPESALINLKQPAMWIFGELDDSNPTALDVMNLIMLKTTYDKDFSINVYKDTTHEMQNIKTGTMEMLWVTHLSQWIENQLIELADF